jgi:hypothetical protein
VLKPNVGQRGSGFKLISSQTDAEKYLAQVTADVIIQRYIQHEKEIGVFYYRIPGQQHGEVFAVTQKLFPTVIGDGASTLEQLLQKDERASLLASTYLRRFAQLGHEVLGSGVRVRLVEAGNHCQGCIFQDGSDLLSIALRDRIDEISEIFLDSLLAATIFGTRVTKISRAAGLRSSNSMVLHRKRRISTMRETR